MANVLSSSYKLTQLFAPVCAILLLSACRLFYLYKKVPTRQTSPIDKTGRLNSQHLHTKITTCALRVRNSRVSSRTGTKINYTCIIPQDIDFVKSPTLHIVFGQSFHAFSVIGSYPRKQSEDSAESKYSFPSVTLVVFLK